jgi:hypothetical protein
MVKKEYGTITFSYSNDELFNDVSLLSSYMVKNMVFEAGSALDEFVITDDEKDVWKVCLKQALPNIYEALLKISSGVTDSFNDNVEVGSKKYLQIKIKDNKEYNTNVLSIVESTLRDCINYGTLVEFYSININDGLLNLAKGKFNNYMFQLNKRLFQLKKKSINIC